MKRLLLLAALVFTLVPVGTARAAACEIEDAPTAALEVPALPQPGSYVIWTRMKTPDAANIRYQLEVNGDTCFTVFHDGPVDQWTWVNVHGTRANPQTVSYNFANASGNRIKLIGMDENVKIDRLLVLSDGCIPEGTGDNCRAGATTIAAQPNVESIDQTPSDPVSGKVFVSSALTQSSKDVLRVEYYSDGKKVQESNGIAPFDTTLVDNGIHTITTRIFWTDGTSEDSINTITVKNPQTTFSPLMRWARLHQRILFIVGIILAAVSLTLLTLTILRSIQLRRRNKQFHGF